MITNKDIAIQYADDIISGRISACLYVIQACVIFKHNLSRPDLYFNDSAVNAVNEFINTLYLTEQVKPTHFILEPWQVFIVANIYGFYYVESNRRKHKYVYIEIPRKNGKSQLVNALAIFHLIFDNESQVVVSANSREQAKNVDYKKCCQFCEQLDPKKKHLKPQFTKIKYQQNELIVTASDSKKLDGLNCSVGIVDELHEAKNSGMYDVLKSSQGSRLDPLLMVITTAGFDTTSFCYQMREYTTKILAGAAVDDSQFSLIYTLDEGDDYTIESNWYKANPNLDVSVYKDFLQSEVVKAINNPVETAGVKVKNFNIWLSNKGGENQMYIDMEFIRSSMQKINIEDEIFTGCNTFVGIDLSQTSDLTATCYLIELDDKYYFFIKYFLPEDSRNSGKNKKQFLEWANQGYITLTSGNVLDYRYITDDLINVNVNNEINEIYYDPCNARQWALETQEQGLYTKPFSQHSKSMNEPLKELSRLIMQGNVIIQYNPVTEWCFNNCIVKESNNLIRIDKKNGTSSNKIDGAITMANAFACYVENNNYGFNIW